ncbi:MAG TPA: N-acetylneuraminate synthase family protein, partial [Nitrosopumilaceae archaeon]|nr:N-acetylneuraminate synthase family protein [Nitrosopumilaceae archaeon]
MVFIIGEIGVNWNGNFELAREMMENAKKAGCNAVKFQAFHYDMVKNHPKSLLLTETTISKKNVESINELSKSVGIEWFCTPMYPEAVDFLDPYVKRFKVREIDGRHLLENKTTPLIDRVFETDKEVIVSSQISPRNCKYFNSQKIKWLYCIPKYPCQLEEIDFSNLRDFHGFSNHSPQIIAPLMATILGATMLEVHITSSKSSEFIDNNV